MLVLISALPVPALWPRTSHLASLSPREAKEMRELSSRRLKFQACVNSTSSECVQGHSPANSLAPAPGAQGAPAGPAPQACCTFLSITGPLSCSLKTQAESKEPVPASLLFTPPSGRCHLARAIIHRHTKWPMEEKLVTLEEQMTSDRLCSWFFTTTEETGNCRGGPTPEQASPFQAVGLPLLGGD